MRMADPRSHEGERGPSGPAGQPRGAAIMSVWLEQARSFPNGVVATPHYLASNAGLAMLASGGNAVDAALAANLVLAVVTPYMCGVGGDLLAIVWDGEVNAYRGVGRAPASATHAGAWVEPLRANVRGTEVLEMPPPTQGIAALEALRIAHGFDLGADGPDREHVLIEAMKLALADRDAHLGDPDAMTTPPEALLTDTFVDERRSLIDPLRARQLAPRLTAQGGTIYMNTADRDGLLVSLIQSNFFGAGCGLRVDEWGINLHNRGSAFNFDDGHPNAFGPKKMPLHTLIPALALRDGRPWLVFGSEGGHGQAQTHLQLLTRMLVDGADPQAAITAPRFTLDPDTGRVAIEDRFDPDWIDELRRRGHEIDVVPVHRHGPGIAHAIECLHPGYRAGSDPRAEGGVAC